MKKLILVVSVILFSVPSFSQTYEIKAGKTFSRFEVTKDSLITTNRIGKGEITRSSIAWKQSESNPSQYIVQDTQRWTIGDTFGKQAYIIIETKDEFTGEWNKYSYAVKKIKD